MKTNNNALPNFGRAYIRNGLFHYGGALMMGLFLFLFFGLQHAEAQRKMEYLDRGLVALELKNGVYLSWRMLGTDDPDIGFNIYKNGNLINGEPITTSTNHVDYNGTVSDMYYIETILANGEVEKSKEVSVWEEQYATENPGKPNLPFKRIPLPEPPYMEGVNFTPGEMSVGDLNGDGQYELVFEWEPDTGINPFLEAIDLDGNSLWRIEGGPNTNKGKLNFLVYDLDLDGKAEVTMITGPGTKDGTGNHLSNGPAATDDNNLVIERNSGRLMGDPAYITVFNGGTGKELTTTTFWPPIGPIEDHEETWGDDYGHRASSLKGAVLNIKDLGPVVVYARGIYTRIAMAAFHWDGQQLNEQWKFDSNDPGNEGYAGQGNHSVSVGDVDNDGSDELMYGAMAIDHDGTGLYTTERGHGDADHLADHLPDRPGLEFFQPHENSTYGITMRDAATGEIIWEYLDESDVGRAWAADVDPDYRGSEVVAIGFPNYDPNGNEIPTNYNAYNQPIYFDGDVQRERRGGASINGDTRLLTGWYYGASTIHGSKNDANLIADILGDWREEMVIRNGNNQELLLFSTWIPTGHKNYTLMHDPVYRLNIVVQNVGYNQPAHVGYYFADGAPAPDIELIKAAEVDCNGVSGGSAYVDECGTCVGGDTGKKPCTLIIEGEAACEKNAVFDDSSDGYSGDGYLTVDYGDEAVLMWTINSDKSQSQDLFIKYSNGSSLNNNADLVLNDQSRKGITFAPTRRWDQWATVKTTLMLEEGINKIELKGFSGGDKVNIDFAGFTGEGLSSHNCLVTNLIDYKEGDFVVYPNPSSEFFNIKGYNTYHYKIYNLNGVMMEEGEGTSQSKLGENLRPGEYLMLIEEGQEYLGRRIRKE